MESLVRLKSETARQEKILTPEIRKETLHKLAEIQADPKAFIDEGGAANVYRVVEGVCMKILKPHYDSQAEGLQLGNSLAKEALFLKMVSGLVYKGVRTPRYLGLVKNETLSALLMEEIPAVNLRRVISGKETLPATFDSNAFFKGLEEYLSYLHEEKEIAHGDFESRNIMVDRLTGAPYVIDFGRSVFLKSLEDEKKEQALRADAHNLDLIFQEFSEADSTGVLTYSK